MTFGLEIDPTTNSIRWWPKSISSHSSDFRFTGTHGGMLPSDGKKQCLLIITENLCRVKRQRTEKKWAYCENGN